MSRSRMEAFSDGVLAIIITIMVLKLNIPENNNFLGIKNMLPTLLAYVLSYVYVGIYWANHHHLLSAVDSVSGSILWKNLHWLFWMSLIPLTTEWVGLYPLVELPAFFYGIVLFMCAISYHILQQGIIKISGKDSQISKSIGKDRKGKMSIVFYAIGFMLSFVSPIGSYIVYAVIALVWIVPDPRIEKIQDSY